MTMSEEAVDALLRKDGLRSGGPIHEDVRELLRERRTLRWRLAEVQKALDDGYDAGDRRVIRVSRAPLTFILTGDLPE